LTYRRLNDQYQYRHLCTAILYDIERSWKFKFKCKQWTTALQFYIPITHSTILNLEAPVRLFNTCAWCMYSAKTTHKPEKVHCCLLQGLSPIRIWLGLSCGVAHNVPQHVWWLMLFHLQLYHCECYILIQSEACNDHKRACYMDKLDLNWVISLDINKSGKMERTIVLRKNK
jgi:hypothetical protein